MSGMKKRKRKKTPPREGYVLLPSVTHPQGRARLFEDAMKAMVRAMVESGQPMWGYAIDKADRIVTTENRHLLSPEEQAEWDAACDEFEAMWADEQRAWTDKVLSTYPKMDQLADPDSYNAIN